MTKRKYDRKNPKMDKTMPKVIGYRTTSDQYWLIDSMAKADGVTVSEWVRVRMEGVLNEITTPRPT